jgi:hypothetical protein
MAGVIIETPPGGDRGSTAMLEEAVEALAVIDAEFVVLAEADALVVGAEEEVMDERDDDAVFVEDDTAELLETARS